MPYLNESTFDPGTVGGSISNYMRFALSGDPRMKGINQNLSGRIAPDVIRQLQQGAAERGIGIGSYGGGNDASGYLRALGLTSLDLTNKGIGQYADAYNSVPKLNPGDLFESEGAREARLAQQRMQTERLQSDAQLQQGRLNQDQGQFNVNRGDTISGKNATAAAMDAMIARLGGLGGGGGSGGGNAWGGTNYSPAGGGTSASAWSYAPKSDINNVTSDWVDPGYYGEAGSDYVDPTGWDPYYGDLSSYPSSDPSPVYDYAEDPSWW